METGESWNHGEGQLGAPGLGRGRREEGVADSPCPPCLHGVMQGRQWDLAHDEEDDLGALISGQRAGKGACGERMAAKVGPGEATSR